MFQHKVDQAKPIMFQQDIDQGYIKHGEMFHPAYVSLLKQPFLLALRRWRRFARSEERLRLSDRNSILMTYINVYIINPVGMGFQMQIGSILRFSWSILVKCCVHLQTSSSKTQIFLSIRIYSTNID